VATDSDDFREMRFFSRFTEQLNRKFALGTEIFCVTGDLSNQKTFEKLQGLLDGSAVV